ncbi:MAG: DUF4173 domain-containing protein [Pseudonocardia sp.]|nr:DUF4173 domain-containing protein [Pseudonocardia sp.]
MSGTQPVWPPPPPPGWPFVRPVPPPAPLFGDRWPGPSMPPSGTLLGVVAAAGVATAAAVPEGRPGLGWLVTALAITAAALALGWHTRRSPPPAPAALIGAAWTVAAVGLSAVSAVRDAPWLVTLGLLTACLAGSLAVVGRSFRGVVAGALAVPVAAVRGLPWVGRCLLAARRGGGGAALRVAVAGSVGLGLIVVFGALLASADPAFARVLDELMPAVDGSWVRSAVLFGLGGWAVVGAGFLLVAPPAPPGPPEVRPPRLRGLEWTLPAALLVLLFALFVGVQFVTLFGADSYVLRTTGLTYAEYARGGFWELLTVTVLTLGVIVLGSRWAPQQGLLQRAWKRGLLGALACLTLVIVASALSRMWLYQQAYGFTVLRLLVLTCELWLGAGFLVVIVAVLRLRPGSPAPGMVAAGVLALVALAVLDPERFVAERNVARFEETGRIDTLYLSTLSADAVPALVRLPEAERWCSLAGMRATPDDDWRSWNASRTAARAALATVPSGPCGETRTR